MSSNIQSKENLSSDIIVEKVNNDQLIEVNGYVRNFIINSNRLGKLSII